MIQNIKTIIIFPTSVVHVLFYILAVRYKKVIYYYTGVFPIITTK